MSRHNRDEYKWVRDALAGQESVRRVLMPKRKKRATLASVLGWLFLGLSLVLMFSVMLR